MVEMGDVVASIAQRSAKRGLKSCILEIRDAFEVVAKTVEIRVKMDVKMISVCVTPCSIYIREYGSYTIGHLALLTGFIN